MMINDHTDWLEINPVAYKKNIVKVKAITGKPVIPVILANAYVHSPAKIVQTAQPGGAVVCGFTVRLPRI